MRGCLQNEWIQLDKLLWRLRWNRISRILVSIAGSALRASCILMTPERYRLLLATMIVLFLIAFGAFLWSVA